MKIRENTEVVLSVLLFTVASFMAANAWSDFFETAIDKYFEKNIGPVWGRLIYSVVLTIFLFVTLYIFVWFSNIGRNKARKGFYLF